MRGLYRWAAVLPAVLWAQEPQASDEIRLSSQPYVAQGVVFHAESRLVEVGVAVRDGHGRAVAGLTRENFRIYDDGKERPVAAFSEYQGGSSAAIVAPGTGQIPAKEAPARTEASVARRTRYLAVFFDDVNMAYGEESADLKRAQAAATRFLKEALKPGVEIGIFTASGASGLDFTADGEKLAETIAGIKAHAQFAQKSCSGINPYQAYRIAERHDRETLRLVMISNVEGRCGLYTSANEVVAQAEEVWDRAKKLSMETLASVSRAVSELSGKSGERVLLLASTGFVGGTLEEQQDRIIDQAVHAGVVINALVTKGLFNEAAAGERFDTDPAPDKAVYTARPGYQRWAKAENEEVAERPMVMDEAMGDLAHGTGGVLFHNNNDLNAGFRETSVAPEVAYRLAFVPEGITSDGSYHKLQVKLTHGGGGTLTARPGYFAADEMARDDQRAKLDHEVMGADSMAGLTAGVALAVEKPSDSQRTVRVVTHVDLSKLSFVKQDDRERQRITFVAVFFDQQGKIAAAKEGRMDLDLKPDTYQRLVRTGVNAALTFPMAPGVYRLRAVVQEAVQGEMAASTYPVEVK
ncbi:MAG TPA: VWA domain-containing protein [Bryobacteraceae bacterium]|nr:VWA domain-containing protein [Bryobacteraceae bacterium]